MDDEKQFKLIKYYYWNIWNIHKCEDYVTEKYLFSQIY